MLFGAEKPDCRIAGIKVEGNERYSRREIISWSKLKTGDVLSEEKLLTGMKRVIDRFAEEGFFFAAIDSLWREYSPDSARVELTIFLLEGPQTGLKSVSVSDSGGAPRPDLELLFPRKKIFHPKHIESGIDESLRRLEEDGYPFCRLELGELGITVGEDLKELSTSFTVERGPKVRLSGVEVRGNRLTRKRFIIRETRLRKGELFSPQAFDRAEGYLKRRGLFEEVKPLELIRRDDEFFALAQVKEGRHNSVDGAVGYFPGKGDEKGYWTGLVDFSSNNLFGTGRRFHVHWEQPDRKSQDISISYREPWVGGIPLDLDASLKQSIRASTGFSTLGGNDRFITRSAVINGYFPLNETVEITGGVTHDEVLPDSTARYISGIPHSLAVGLQGGFTIDTRDDHSNPRRGMMYHNLGRLTNKKNYVSTGSELPADVEERRLEVNFEAVYSLTRQGVVDLRMSGRHLESGQQTIPISEMYFLGGAHSLRGYREEQFAGTSLAWSNLEYRIIMGKHSRLFLFSDYGYFYRKIGGADGELTTVNGWRFGYGAGIRLETDLGIIGVDYGLGKGDSPANGKLHLQVRSEF